MVNRVILIGNLGKDPEVRRLENGAVVAKFSVATNENYRDKSGEWQTLTEWHDVVVWRSLAERAETQLKKGMLVYVDGKLTHRSWEDQDGNKRRTTEVVGNYFRALGTRSGSEGGGGYFPSADDEHPGGYSTSSIEPASSGAPTSEPVITDTADDDLPF
ncbi:MAG: single-stranded DNA-binding protein [Saprospiraceae bacterium]|nr:single-stranded DNA-binding protein [Lewinella sp.]